MRRVGLAIAILIAAFGLGTEAAGAQVRLTPLDSASRWVDSIFAPVSSRQGPGCAVGVVQNGALTFAKGYGTADLEHDTPIRPRHGSISPPSRSSSPRWPSCYSRKTIGSRSTIRSASGCPRCRRWAPASRSPAAAPHERPARLFHAARRVGMAERRGPLTEQQLLSLVARQKKSQLSTPGDEFLYSNTGYALLGHRGETRVGPIAARFRRRRESSSRSA